VRNLNLTFLLLITIINKSSSNGWELKVAGNASTIFDYTSNRNVNPETSFSIGESIGISMPIKLDSLWNLKFGVQFSLLKFSDKNSFSYQYGYPQGMFSYIIDRKVDAEYSFSILNLPITVERTFINQKLHVGFGVSPYSIISARVKGNYYESAHSIPVNEPIENNYSVNTKETNLNTLGLNAAVHGAYFVSKNLGIDIAYDISLTNAFSKAQPLYSYPDYLKGRFSICSLGIIYRFN
jgi:hypothetical protein